MDLTRICLRCRTLLGEGATCDACEGRDETVSLRTEEGRGALRNATWIAARPEVAAPSEQSFRAFALFSLLLLVGVIAGSIWAVKAAHTGLFFAIVFGGPVLWTVVILVRVLGSSGPRPPFPAKVTPAAHYSRERRTGTVVAGSEGGPPLAEGLTLDLAKGRGVMLRAGWSEPGFEVELEDGGRLRVPPGRLRVDDPAAPLSPVLPRRWADRFAAAALEVAPTFPHERVQAVALAGGERVEVVALVETERVDSSAYREEAAARLVTKGTPWVLVLDGGRRRKPDAEEGAAPTGADEAATDRAGSVFMGLLVAFLVLFFASGIFGYALTWLPSLTESSWRGWALARVILTLGSGVGVAATIAFPMLPADRRRGEKDAPPRGFGRRLFDFLKVFLLASVIALPLGALFCRAPLTDLVRGPVEAEVTAVRVDSRHGTRHNTVSYTLEVELESGETLRSGGCLSAPHAPAWQRMAEPCRDSGAPMHVRFLQAMMAPLEVECLEGRPGGP